MELLIQQLDIELLEEEEFDTGFSVVNNACWSCGEIALQQGIFFILTRICNR
jgi:transportin-1